VENEININPCKIKVIRFTTAQVKFHWVTLLVTKKFRNRAVLNSWEYLGVPSKLHSENALKALHF